MKSKLCRMMLCKKNLSGCMTLAVDDTTELTPEVVFVTSALLHLTFHLISASLCFYCKYMLPLWLNKVINSSV